MPEPPEPIPISDVLITDELDRRSPRQPDWQAENRALRSLASQLVHEPEVMLQSLVDLAIELCDGEPVTAGVSLVETEPDGKEVFRWVALSGTLADQIGGCTPRHFSPCGVCLEQGAPVLFAYPERYFTYFQAANIPFVEGLVLPLMAEGQGLGTIWIITHNEQRQFDPEDVRLMTGLADFTAAALLRHQQQAQALQATHARLAAKEADRQLAAAQSQALIANLPGGAAFVVDRDLRYQMAAGEALAIAGFVPDDFVGRTIFEVLPPDIAASYERFYRQALAGEPFEHEHQAHGRWYISRGTPLRTEDGEIYAVLAVSYEITERKQAEAALRESQEKYRSLFNSMDEAYAVVEVLADDNGEWNDFLFLEVNPMFVAQTGMEYPVGRRATELLGTPNPNWARVYGQVAETGEPIRFEEGEATLDRVFDLYVFRLGEAGSRRVAVLFTDITDRKRAEIALRESEERLRDVFDSMVEGFALLSSDFTILDVNAETLRLDGRDRDELIGRSHWEAFPGTEDSPVGAIFKGVARDGLPGSLEHEYRWPDGRSLWLDMRAYPTQNGGVAIFWRDVTNRKQTEIALRESEAKYRSIFDSIDEGFCIYELIDDDDGKPIDLRWVEVNPAYEKQTGLQDTVGKRHSELSLNTESYWFEIYDHVAKTGEAADFENWHEPTGRWYRVFASRLGNAGSRQVAVVFEDITDRKRREANLTFLADLMNDFAPLATAEDIMEMAGKRIAEHLDLSRYMFVEIFPEAGTCTYLLPSHPPGQLKISGSFVLADYHTEAEHRLLCAGHSMIVNDVRDGTRTPEQIAAFEMFDIGAIVNTPYLSNGRWVFDLGVARSQPSVWREDEIELLRELSARVWLRIERARAEAALRQSEAKYRSLFTSMDEGYFLCDVIFDENDQPIDLFYIDENPAAVRMTGQSFRGQRLREISPDYEDYWYEIFGRVAQTGQAERLERYAAPDQIWYDFYVFKVGSPDTRRVAVVFNDVTERKHNEQRQAFLLQLSDALRSLDDAVEIEATVTQTALHHFGADRCYYCEIEDGNSIIRRDAARDGLPSVAGEYPLSSFPILQAVIESGRPFVVKDVHTTDTVDEDLRQLCIQMQVISYIDVPIIKNGQPVGVLCLVQSTPRDWTNLEVELAIETAERIWAAVERARAETALQEMMQNVRALNKTLEQRVQARTAQLEAINQELEAFSSTVSHDLQTPLRHISSFVRRLQDKLETLPVDDSSRRYLSIIDQAAAQAQQMTTDLLEFSRMGQTPLHLTQVSMNDLVQAVRSQLTPELTNRAIKWHLEPLPEVQGDPQMLRLVLQNLVSNAVKYTRDRPTAHITIGSTEHNYETVFFVQDNGAGFDMKYQDRLFSLFQRLHSPEQFVGNGVGLANVRRIIHRHGGRVWAEGAVDQGATFYFSLPATEAST